MQHKSTQPKPSIEPHPSKKTGPFNFQIFSKPTNETFSSRGAKPKRHTVEIVLSIPEDDEECPLTLESIAASKLPCLPDTPFLQDRPLHSKLTLPCGHSFSAMTLIYSFCKNNMTCPCCRAGKEVQADFMSLPAHFRSQLNAHIKETLETERRHDESREFEEIIESYNMYGVTIPYEVLGSNGNLSLVANFYDIPTGISNDHSSTARDSLRPIFSFSNMVEPRRESNGRMTMVPRGQLRALTHIAHMGVNAVQLSIMLSMQGTGDILIDATPITRLPDIRDENAPTRLTIPGASSSSVTQNNQFQVLVQLQRNESNTPATSFSVLFNRSGHSRHFVLDTIMWNPGTENLEILSSNVQLAAEL